MQPSRLDELLRAEREVAPEPGADDRIWAAIEHRLSHGPPPPAGAEAAPGALGGAAVLKVAAGLALVAAAAGALASRGWDGDKGHVPEDMPVVAAVEPAAPVSTPSVPPVEPVAPPQVAAEPEAPFVPASVVAPVEPAEKKPVRTKRVAAKTGEVEPVESPPPAEDFAAELQLVAEIRGALKRGDHAQALAKVDEHARRFGARGQLVQERLAYQVEALCGLGREADARRVAGELLAKWPDSTHAPRVRSSCAGA